jgi:hypothetical protein
MKPPMANMYSFCSRFASVMEAIEMQSFSDPRSNYVPTCARAIEQEHAWEHAAPFSQASIRLINRLEAAA